ncbi:hypothetical protein [Paenibacillus crassostreae]|uniref:Uncharacterized protein n=1 Tax=Paenibacillus crassostreae TaxID=1763538 RepID=A0A167FQN0_9BACL|nr:hypothetical protein [Paenibacillus crassostreae]AOZ94161.1 hypothetical protein LPB68_19515 [Paenibacillus crassostreae]OAB76802.1 hypothetical protein PNBC_05225 [Paenibacillus crassostreae]
MSFLPPAKSRRWFLWMAIYGTIIWILLGIYRFIYLGQPLDMIILLRLALFAYIVAGILHGFGWLGARLVWFITTLGITIGMLLMFLYTYRDMSGWEDLAGFLTLAVFLVGAFVLGLLVEGIYLLIKRYRRTY